MRARIHNQQSEAADQRDASANETAKTKGERATPETRTEAVHLRPAAKTIEQNAVSASEATVLRHTVRLQGPIQRLPTSS